ncbi:MAG: hypothetical protein ABSA66_19315 [Roseiarcus sp.]|jgi:hypothetical protein
MITFVRTAAPLPGKFFELLAFAKEISALIKRLTGKDVSVSAAVGGPAGELAWTLQYDNLAQLEETTGKLLADPEYRATFKKLEGLVVPGSTRDQIWRRL